MDCQKDLFTLPGDLHYLNCAYMSPLLKSVEEAGKRGIRDRGTPWAIQPTDFFRESEQLRSLFAEVINAERPGQIAIMPAVSYGLATVAKNLPRKSGRNIVIAGEQFPSNVYPWMRFCRDHDCELLTVDSPEAFQNRGKGWNQRILEAIDDSTILVALGNIHWADGTLFALDEIGNRAREVGARLVIDGTQSVGALPLDVQKLRPDALICAGYKWLMGPYSMALGYFGEQMLDGVPLEEGWIARKDSENFSGLVNYEEKYQPGAIRFDVGERSNFILVPMMIKALEQILAWEPGNIQKYCKKLTGSLQAELAPLGYRLEDEPWRASHMFGIRLPDEASITLLQEKLSQKNIHVSLRGSAVRVAPNVYNDEHDIQLLIDTLKEVVE